MPSVVKFLSSSLVAQLFYNAAGEVFLDLAVARNGLAHFRARVLIPIVLSTMPDKNATHARELLDEFGPL